MKRQDIIEKYQIETMRMTTPNKKYSKRTLCLEGEFDKPIKSIKGVRLMYNKSKKEQ